jgi:FAD/FMN-containing dehydrogenase
VALPSTVADVATLVRLAGEHAIAVVPRGAGTGLSGGSAGIEGALTICLIGMDRVLEIDHDDLVAVTQPGILNAKFKSTVAAEGLFYAPDPASYEICSIGGNLGTNAGGLCCVKYGQTRESVLGLEIVLADGRIIRTGGRSVKDVAGYALTQLFVGSQGTLGIVTEAILRLRPAPPPRQTLLAFFATLEAAGEAVGRMTRKGLTPVTLELMDRFTIGAVDDWQHLGLDREAAAMLMIESDLPGAGASAQLDLAEAGAREAGATSLVRAADPQEADWLRQGRREAFHALERLGIARMEDVGVPRSKIPAMGISTRRSSSTGTIRTRNRSTRQRAATCTGPPLSSAGRSRLNTGSGSPGATISSSSWARTWSALCARSSPPSIRAGSSTPAGCCRRWCSAAARVPFPFAGRAGIGHLAGRRCVTDLHHARLGHESVVRGRATDKGSGQFRHVVSRQRKARRPRLSVG